MTEPWNEDQNYFPAALENVDFKVMVGEARRSLEDKAAYWRNFYHAVLNIYQHLQGLSAF
jgi:hypothetical protein